jgi:formate dehydrogenase (coenzyme F420) beta subunit
MISGPGTASYDDETPEDEMIQKGDMLYAWANDPKIREKAQCGGVVTALLKYALETGMIDAVLAVRKGRDIYEAIPTVITEPEEVVRTAGTMHCGTLLISRFLLDYLKKEPNKRVAIPAKGCDVLSISNLGLRGKINPNNILLFGLTCGGTITPETARKMIQVKFGIDPDTVTREEIVRGRFFIETVTGGRRSISMEDLEEEGFGRRTCCRGCETKIPRQADIVCGNWGVIGEHAGNATFIEIGSEKGANLLREAADAGTVTIEPAPSEGIEIRMRKERAMIQRAQVWRKRGLALPQTNR